MKHTSQISTEFVKIAKAWWEGKMFRHPDTNNRVKFKSLPIEEQRRLNAQHEKEQTEEKPKSKAERRKERLKRKKERLERKKERLRKKKEREKRKKEKAKARREKAKAKKVTPKTHPNFYTEDGKRLNTVKGYNTEIPLDINPKWDPKTDNAFYATQDNPKTKSGKDYFYTMDYIKRKGKEKFAKNQRFGQMLPKIRKRYAKDLVSKDPRKRAYATAIALVDQSACRIGNKGSEEADDVRGLHNLQAKHVTMDGNNVTFSYIGKKKVHQEHSFEVDDVIKKNLEELLKDKSDDDSVFEFEKKGKMQRITPRFVNRYLRFNLKSPVTVHHFRHYHGTRLAQEYLDELDPQKFSKTQMQKSIDSAAETVSEFLGNTKNVAKKHYIDPTVFENFYKRAGMKMPKKKAASDEKMKKESASKFNFNTTSAPKEVTEQEENFNNWMSGLNLDDLD